MTDTILMTGAIGFLENFDIHCSKTLFVDSVLCVANPFPGLRQDR